MPLYEYQCSKGHVTTELRAVWQRHEPTLCPTCQAVAKKAILTPPRIFGDYEGYESPASGRWIEGRRARAEDLARTGCRPYDPGEKEDLLRRQKAQDAALDRAVDGVVEQTLHEITR